MTALDAAIKEKRTADVLTIGNGILANDPENLNVIYTIASAVRGEMIAPAAGVHERARGHGGSRRRASRSSSPARRCRRASFDKNATLAWMTQMLALNEQKAGNADEAVKLFEKSTSYAPKDKAIVAPNLVLDRSRCSRPPTPRPRRRTTRSPTADRVGGRALGRGQGGPRES